MTNKEIAGSFKLTAALMELHGENPFKIKSYNNAYINLRKIGESLLHLPKESLESIPGIGKTIAEKIVEIQETGTFLLFEEMKSKTPSGVIELLSISGLGPKKVEIIWKIMGIEDPGALLYACTENRLIEFKGFGVKSQKSIEEKLHFYFTSKGKLLYPDALLLINDFIHEMVTLNPLVDLFPGGQVLRKEQIVDRLEIFSLTNEELIFPEAYQLTNDSEGCFILKGENGVNIHITKFSPPLSSLQYLKYLFEDKLSDSDLIKYQRKEADFIDFKSINGELNNLHSQIFNDNFPISSPEIWSTPKFYSLEKKLVDIKDLRGLVHLHTTYSDGINTLEEMVQAAIDRNFEYMVVTDHSKFAFYAKGLDEERLIFQLNHIDQLNEKYFGKIKILKGIECDILPDGSIDYTEEIWKLLDLMIISIHSNLNMDKEKATKRLLNAIENPYANILGHPSGRVILSRNGYDLDYDLIFQACVDNNVHIELNASPQRLDLDHNLIDRAQKMGIKISINPDAHSISGIDNIVHGITAARRGGLLVENCLNTLKCDDFLEVLGKK